MRLPTTHKDCCPRFDPAAYETRHCFCEEICQDMMRLRKRHKRMFAGMSPRIMEIARPNFRVTRFQPKCLCPFPKPVELIRDEERKRTRTEQLSYPSVKKLLLFKKRVKHLFDEQRMERLNRLIRKSLLSLYSTLYNSQPPQKPKPKTKMTDAKKAKLNALFDELSKPKKQPKPARIDRKSKPIEEMKRLKRLSKPKKYQIDTKPEWQLTPSMKNYKATERIIEMSKPKLYDEDLVCRPFPTAVPNTALGYQATQRIQTLAEPHVRGKDQPTELKENPFAIAPNALKYTATARIQELANPKEYQNVHIRENPGAVSPAALKARATPRIIALAKPKA